MKNLTDLHAHTNTKGSDGEMSPKEFISYVNDCIKEIGVEPKDTIIALTDHNTTEGLRKTWQLCGERGIKFVPGCEVMVFDEGYGNFEILGYGSVDMLTNERLAKTLQNIKESMESRIRQQTDMWYRKGININRQNIRLADEEYQKITESDEKFNDWAVFGGIFTEKLVQAFGKEPTIPEIASMFYGHFREPDGALYIPCSNKEIPKPEEVISLFNELGVIPVLAHPGEYNINEGQRDKLLGAIIEMGIGGLEVYSRKNSDSQIRKYLALAKEKDMIIAGGCDFHKDTSQYRIGTYRQDKFVPFETGERLYERIS